MKRRTHSRRRSLARRLALLFAATIGAASLSAPAQAEACQVNCLYPGDYDFTLKHDGLDRSYKVHVPFSYRGDKPVPLVVDMHGWNSNSWQQRLVSGQLGQSDRRGFIVIYPQGFENSWNGFKCCGEAMEQNVDDVGFIREVVARVRRASNIDGRRIYATGLSNGGSMSFRLACDAADLFSAAAPVSQMLNEPERCKPSRAINVTAFHGLFDALAPYGGSRWLGFQSARESFASWATIQGCNDTLQSRQLGFLSRAQTFTQCRNGTKVGLVTISGGHITYLNWENVNISDYIWQNVFTTS